MPGPRGTSRGPGSVLWRVDGVVLTHSAQERYAVHWACMRATCPEVNVFMQES